MKPTLLPDLDIYFHQAPDGTWIWVPPDTVNAESFMALPFNERALQIARYFCDKLELREIAKNTDRGGIIDRALRRLGLGPNPWCAAIMWLCCQLAGWPFDWKPSNPASVRSWVAAAKKAGRLITLNEKSPNRTIFRGMLYGWSNGMNGHIGIGVRREGGRVYGIEGNTNTAGSAEGDGMFRKWRRPNAFFPGRWFAIDLRTMRKRNGR